MGALDAALARAFAQLRNGGGTVWAPDLTTAQLARLEDMKRLAAAPRPQDSRVFAEDLFFVWYDADCGVEPDADTPAWEEHTMGAVTKSVAGGLLTVTIP